MRQYSLPHRYHPGINGRRQQDKGENMKVLVTGSSGLIGSMLINTLADSFEFSGLDARSSEHAPDVPTLITDGSDYESMSNAFEGVDAVVHMGANALPEGLERGHRLGGGGGGGSEDGPVIFIQG